MYGLLGSETQVMIGNFVKDEFSETSLCVSALEHGMKLISSNCVLLASINTIHQYCYS